MKFVRIVILNYNSSKYCIDLIGMLRNQIYDAFEMVVVDNSSREDQVNILKAQVPSDVHLLLLEQNLGYSGGNNAGMRYDSGKSADYFLILNDDVIIDDPRFIEKLVNSFSEPSSQEIIAVSPLTDTVLTNKPVEYQIQVRKILAPLELLIISFALLNKIFAKTFKRFIYQEQMPYANKYMFCDSINGCAFMVKAPFMYQQNFLDDHVFLFHEELILGKQILNAGGTCMLNGYTS